MDAGLPMGYFEELKQYLHFDELDEQMLRQLHPLAAPFFDTIAQDFYDRMRDLPNAMAVFRGDEQVLRLQATLAKWMDKLLTGPWDEAYFELRSRIGKVHVQIDLPQHYMFAAMAVIQEHLTGIAVENFSADDAQAITSAVHKVTNIDLAIMLESYRVHFVNRVQALERSERSTLKSRLEQTEALYHSIFESSGVAIIICSGDQNVRLFNSMAESLTGYARLDVVNHDFCEVLIHPHDLAEMRELLREAHASSVVAPRELRLIAADSSDKWVRWHATAIESTQDICLLGIDVTRERKLAAQTRRIETLAALGTLAAGLAHEIRNPLNAAQLQLMLVERALKKAESAVGERALYSSELVKEELKRLAGLVEDFLAFARPTDLRVDNADVGNICDTLVELMGTEAASHGISLTGEHDELVVARIDGEKVKQVLINLLRNAIEAASKEVKLSARRIGQSVFLEVEDDGAGIPADIDIFEPFTTSKDTGTGLGLPIVHRIVTDHGGSIDHERRDAHTVFKIELPLDGPPSP